MKQNAREREREREPRERVREISTRYTNTCIDPSCMDGALRDWDSQTGSCRERMAGMLVE